MIFRDRIVLTNNNWGVCNVEILFDLSYLIVLSLLSIAMGLYNSSTLLLPFLLFILSGIIYLLIFKKVCGYVYPFGVISDILICFLFMPIIWMDPFYLAITLVLSWGILFTIRYQLNSKIPFSMLAIGIQGLVHSFFGKSELIEMDPFKVSEFTNFNWIPNNIDILPIFGDDSTSIWLSLSWLGFFPYCLSVIRRYSVLFVGFFIYLWVYMNLNINSMEMKILYSASYSGFFFGLYIIPGRNHYSKFLTSLLSLGFIYIISFFRYGILETDLFLFIGIFIFFIVEAIFSGLFYGKGRGRYEPSIRNIE